MRCDNTYNKLSYILSWLYKIFAACVPHNSHKYLNVVKRLPLSVDCLNFDQAAVTNISSKLMLLYLAYTYTYNNKKW